MFGDLDILIVCVKEIHDSIKPSYLLWNLQNKLVLIIRQRLVY